MFGEFVGSLRRALARARLPILAVALTYLISVLAGALMVHAGNEFAFSFRDDLVAKAQTGSVLTQAEPLTKALTDFRDNLFGASIDTVGGFGIVFPFPLVAYRGWVGGIVSVDGSHASRILDPKSSAYYLSVVLLQLTGYTLAAGAGVNVGFSLWRLPPHYAGPKWLGMSAEALRDLLRIYALVIPILLVASLWEFLSPWN